MVQPMPHTPREGKDVTTDKKKLFSLLLLWPSVSLALLQNSISYKKSLFRGSVNVQLGNDVWSWCVHFWYIKCHPVVDDPRWRVRARWWQEVIVWGHNPSFITLGIGWWNVPLSTGTPFNPHTDFTSAESRNTFITEQKPLEYGSRIHTTIARFVIRVCACKISIYLWGHKRSLKTIQVLWFDECWPFGINPYMFPFYCA